MGFGLSVLAAGALGPVLPASKHVFGSPGHWPLLCAPPRREHLSILSHHPIYLGFSLGAEQHLLSSHVGIVSLSPPEPPMGTRSRRRHPQAGFRLGIPQR